MHMKLGIAGALLVAAGLGSAASAAPVRWAVNGHYYQYISSDATWSEALTLASQLAPIGRNPLTPYLATVTSAAENSFIASVMPVGGRAWLGGADSATEGVWTWVAGPEAGTIFFGPGAIAGTYGNWIPGEPNDRNGVEDSLEILSFSRVPFQWNDLPLTDDAPNGFLVEWSTATGGVPEPASWAMMVAGFGLAGSVARRRRTVGLEARG